jgi:hypothetical protein
MRAAEEGLNEVEIEIEIEIEIEVGGLIIAFKFVGYLWGKYLSFGWI